MTFQKFCKLKNALRSKTTVLHMDDAAVHAASLTCDVGPHQLLKAMAEYLHN